MDFAVPAEYAELQKDLESFIDRELRPLEEAELAPDRDDVPAELRDRVRQRAAELGFYAADFPEDLGGSGLPQLGMVLLREAAARTGCRLAGPDAVGSGFYAAMQFLAMGRLSIAAGCNGIADHCLSLGVDHAKDRAAF